VFGLHDGGNLLIGLSYVVLKPDAVAVAWRPSRARLRVYRQARTTRAAVSAVLTSGTRTPVADISALITSSLDGTRTTQGSAGRRPEASMSRQCVIGTVFGVDDQPVVSELAKISADLTAGR
jgi:hypothetical protein